MYDRCHLWKKPIMGNGIDLEHFVRQISITQSCPTCEQDATLLRAGQSLQDDFRHFLRVTIGHAAKTNVDWRWARGQEIHQVGWWTPIRLVFYNPGTGDVVPVTPVGWWWNEAGAVGVKNGETLLAHLGTQPLRGKWRHL